VLFRGAIGNGVREGGENTTFRSPAKKRKSRLAVGVGFGAQLEAGGDPGRLFRKCFHKIPFQLGVTKNLELESESDTTRKKTHRVLLQSIY